MIARLRRWICWKTCRFRTWLSWRFRGYMFVVGVDPAYEEIGDEIGVVILKQFRDGHAELIHEAHYDWSTRPLAKAKEVIERTNRILGKEGP